MNQADSQATTDLPVAPTEAELDAMWLAARRAEQDEIDRKRYERFRRSVMTAMSGEAA